MAGAFLNLTVGIMCIFDDKIKIKGLNCLIFKN